MSNEEQKLVEEIKAEIAKLPSKIQAEAKANVEAFRLILLRGGPTAYIAFALVGAEIAMEEDDDEQTSH
jgi:hypothetical protein